MQRKEPNDKKRVALVEKYLRDEISQNGAAHEAQVSVASFRRWLIRYKKEGPAGLKNAKRKPHFSRETKLHAVWDYLDGEGSIDQIAQKYGLRSPSSLTGWLKVYNTYGDFKTRKEKISMSQTKATTQKERYQIVLDCLANDKDYRGMAIKYQIPYQNLYHWVEKYEQMGYAGLEDRRGKRKGSLPSRTSEEEMRDELAQLQRHNDYLRMENDILKAAKELERRDRSGKSNT
ncbi:helix-turn-helix domain-containing protein [Tetragenococcus koreensis]|uniref:helix-turn-helix domain-containing protein n=1 Tax=Tetragenococcus koreensis TaxID=290335 RepID=UPI001F48EA16|nr:helix-turn-helix domain-containing protein [Tetragenococcus koreensis]MDN6617978.1 helix-turn-helix domain-containing protein [Enterococcus sp.]MCF1586457.1 helix-turn-helix domain-containing protein [Tetragenococcus koreensis]MCF1616012.1 helix-turn-helix domain-containing protein [Tetragenococcus koreensis]MCF1620863.1 helix-turn-helix domain-containing protein [Tetragenococcus koreensis]MCF1625794.1 helix-turn-helix domain-containing protein [Tetragenococcus koreensis]